MKIKFISTHKSPDKYSFSGNVITAFYGGESEDFDLSDFEGVFQYAQANTILLKGNYVIRNIEIIEEELHITLCQSPPVTKVSYKTDKGFIHLLPDQEPPEPYTKKIEHREGDWTESDWIDATEYDPETLYIQEVE